MKQHALKVLALLGILVVLGAGFGVNPASAATRATISGQARCGAGDYPTRLNLWVPDNGSATWNWSSASNGRSYSRTVTVYRAGQNYVNWDLTCRSGARATGQFFFNASGATARNICKPGVYCG